MIQKIKNTLQTLALLFVVAAPLAVPVSTYAACTGTSSDIAKGANAALGSSGKGAVDCESSKDDPSALTRIKNLAATLVNIFSILIGIVAVIMIIVGGFKYITSNGDSNAVGSAKNTIIYAVIGLVIVALAQIIVRFVLSTTVNAV